MKKRKKDALSGFESFVLAFGVVIAFYLALSFLMWKWIPLLDLGGRALIIIGFYLWGIIYLESN